eukprot:6789957-Lingulodinium_polyedra.AAC.1
MATRDGIPWRIPPECFCRVSFLDFMESGQHDELGHGCRAPYDAVFTADSISRAMHYEFPGNLLQGNLYYGLLFELAIDQHS